MYSNTLKSKNDIRIRCFNFGLKVIALTDRLPNKRSSWVIADQLIRSATSIGANLIEGRAASSRLEFKKFYEIALKSANETEYWLELLKETKLVLDSDVEPLINESIEIAKMLGAGVIKLKSKL